MAVPLLVRGSLLQYLGDLRLRRDYFFLGSQTSKSKVFAFSGGPKIKVFDGSEGSKFKLFLKKMRQI